MSVQIQSNKEEPKARLREITGRANLSWTRQLRFSENTLDYLKDIDDLILKMSDTKPLTTDQAAKFGKNIHIGNSKEIVLETDDFTVLNVLQNLGRISCGNASTSTSQSEGTLPKFIIGSSGEKQGEFCRPWGVCSDPMGRILISDRSNNRIEIFDESGRFILQFGKQGAGAGEFSRPAGIAVDEKCRIIVADKDNHRIQIFSFTGNFLFTFGRQGTKNGEFNYPWDVAVNSRCEIAVSDSKNHRVQLFNANGRFLAKFGFGGLVGGLRQLDSPRSLTFWPDGSLLVTDFNNHKIVIISKSFTKMTTFGREGRNPGEFYRPQGIACHGTGKFAVADGKNYRIQVFDHQGNICKLFGTQGNKPGQFECPQGISFHPNGNLIVVDFGNDRVQVF